MFCSLNSGTPEGQFKINLDKSIRLIEDLETPDYYIQTPHILKCISSSIDQIRGKLEYISSIFDSNCYKLLHLVSQLETMSSYIDFYVSILDQILSKDECGNAEIRLLDVHYENLNKFADSMINQLISCDPSSNYIEDEDQLQNWEKYPDEYPSSSIQQNEPEFENFDQNSCWDQPQYQHEFIQCNNHQNWIEIWGSEYKDQPCIR
jgi:hypothetical protein